MFDSAMGTAAGAAERSDAGERTGPTTVRSTNSATGTNVQEAGVDEPDVVKVDGRHALPRPGRRAHDLRRRRRRAPSSCPRLQLPDLGNGELLVTGDRVVVLGDLDGAYDEAHRRRRIVVIDVEPTPGRPQVVEQTDYDATSAPPACTATSSGSCSTTVCPDLDFVLPRRRGPQRADRPRAQPRARPGHHAGRLAADRATASRVVDCDDVAVPDRWTTALGTITVVGFEPAVVEPDRPTAVATTRHHVLLLPRPVLPRHERVAVRLVGARTDDRLHRPCCAAERHGRHHGALRLRPRRRRHDVRRLRRGRGQVRDRWAMDYADGALRVAVGATNETGNFNSVVTLRETRRDAGRDRPRRQARRRRADQVGALVRRPRDRGHLPPDRPALRRRPHRPGRPAAAGRAQDPRLQRVPPPARRRAG